MNKLNEEILAKFLMGECTEDELREVNAWLEGSGENARELFRLEEIYHLGRLGDTSNTQDIEKAEKRLFKRLEQEKTNITDHHGSTGRKLPHHIPAFYKLISTNKG